MIYLVMDRRLPDIGNLRIFTSYSAMEQHVVRIAQERSRPDWCQIFAYEQDLDELKLVYRYLMDIGYTLIRLPLIS